MPSSERVFVVGVGGSTRPGSATEAAMNVALDAARKAGARSQLFDGHFIGALPLLTPGVLLRTPETTAFVEAMRRADGVIVASPGYHGGIAGVVKNALDYLEDLREDERPYLWGRAVGCIATAAGWQAAVTTLNDLRTLAHALRGWPTPLGAALNTAASQSASPAEREREALQLAIIGTEIVEFAQMRRAWLESRRFADAITALPNNLDSRADIALDAVPKWG
jgi:FMN reductase